MSPRGEAYNQELRERSRRRILQAALELFAERGFHAATMAAIADRAGVSKGLAYNYFEGKGQLLETLVEERLAATMERVEAVASRSGDPRVQLERLVRVRLGEAASSPEATRLWLSLFLHPEAAAALGRARGRLQERMARYRDEQVRLLAGLGSEDPEEDAALFDAVMNGMIFTMLAAPTSVPVGALARRILRIWDRPRGNASGDRARSGDAGGESADEESR